MEGKELDFGDYCIIEQKRFGTKNEMYLHKVVGRLRSNSWVDVPVTGRTEEKCHKEMEDVLACICCGVLETEVRKYRVKDCKPHQRSESGYVISEVLAELESELKWAAVYLKQKDYEKAERAIREARNTIANVQDDQAKS